MSWKSLKEKERFFEELDIAFNTPSTEPLVIPKFNAGPRASSEVKRRVSEPIVTSTKKRRTSSSDRLSSTGVGARPKPVKRPSQTRRTSGSKPEEQKKSDLLDGMVLFFIPNSKKNGVRRFRMTLFAQHGAVVRDSWGDDITHVICDEKITGERVMRDLQMEQFPMGVTIVNELWIPDCLGAKRMVDITKSRYRVMGVQSQTSDESGNTLNLDASQHSLQIKPVNPKKNQLQNTASTEQDHDSLDIQDLIFGRNSPPSSAVLERAALDQESLTPTQDALDQAISEVREIGDPLHGASGEASEDEKTEDDKSEDEADVPAWQKGYTCMYAHDGSESANNPNSKTIEVLSKMQAYYERTNDQWRALSYRKAISTLKKNKVFVATETQARAIPGIGERLAKKIAEIVATGELQRLQNLDSSDHTIELFMGIYGVGKNKALQFVMQGYRTLKDLQEKAQLTDGQKIGIELYDDFSQRIPREEVEKHSNIVLEAAKTLDKDIQITTMGSYRRGAHTCGDIDLMITKPNATASDLMHFMRPLLETLTKSTFLTHTLATSHTDDGSKWHGVSRLPSGLHRRLDLLFVPWKERGAALIYFTGNDIFNRSLRLLASKKGMGLNQRGLFKDTLRGPGRVKITRGSLVEAESEEEIFRILGVPWRPPHLRNC